MAIQFLCPNGHKVHCSEDRAGQAAKCPRCGTRFRIPTIEELSAAGPPSESLTGSSVKAGSGSESETTASGVALGAAQSPDEIEFLCPNDHLLHGPAILQGRPGRCPECGSRFRIPTYQEPTTESGPSFEDAMDREADASSVELASMEQEPSATGSRSGQDVLATVTNETGGNSGSSSGRHPAAQLVTRLWRLKSQGATVEIRYGEGHRLTPDEFLRSLSSATHGVFAVKEPNGTLTLTAIPWEAIHAVIVRGVRQLGE